MSGEAEGTIVADIGVLLAMMPQTPTRHADLSTAILITMAMYQVNPLLMEAAWQEAPEIGRAASLKAAAIILEEISASSNP